MLLASRSALLSTPPARYNMAWGGVIAQVVAIGPPAGAAAGLWVAVAAITLMPMLASQ